jgi:tetratricopeptide (TPR) repeat protein
MCGVNSGRGKSGASVESRPADWTRYPTVICMVLAGLTLAVFWPALHCDFVLYDDPGYFSSNPQVQAGLTGTGVRWAFETTETANWHPITWLSFMLDVELFGKGAFGPHLTNLVLYAADTVLLFLLLRQFTGALWRSAAVAALFALHPLHVEPVAWVSDRKDLLSTLFELLCLQAYGRYAAISNFEFRISKERRESRRWWHYGAALGWYALGLMSKPMLVALPFLLLLLDWWPLKRSGEWKVKRDEPGSGPAGAAAASAMASAGRRAVARWGWLALEKAPFLAMSIVISAVTYVVHQHDGTLSALKGLSTMDRVTGPLTSYLRYLVMVFWPIGLAVPYLYRLDWPMFGVVLAAGFPVAASVLALWAGRRRPYVPVGWFWFAGMLLPVIGFVPTGAYRIMADRYMFLPLAGVLLVVVWGIGEVVERTSIPRSATAAALGVLLISCAALSRRQLGYWRDSGTLFTHTLAVTGDNAMASQQYAGYLMATGQLDEAIRNFRKAIELDPDFVYSYDNMGLALATQGKVDEAMDCYRAALRINPDDGDAEGNLGLALASKGDLAGAIACFRKAVATKPNYAEMWNNLGTSLAEEGKFDEAIEEFRRAVEIEPESYSTYHNMGMALADSGRLPEAVNAYNQALGLNPKSADTRFSLANALARQERFDEAIRQYEESLRLNPANPEAQYDLGYTLVKVGRRDDAVVHLNEALRLNPGYEDAKQLLETLRAGQP